MQYAVANLAQLWHPSAFCARAVLVRILEVFPFFCRHGREPIAVLDYFECLLNSSFSYWDFFSMFCCPVAHERMLYSFSFIALSKDNSSALTAKPRPFCMMCVLWKTYRIWKKLNLSIKSRVRHFIIHYLQCLFFSSRFLFPKLWDLNLPIKRS